ncbi:MAG: alpha/beta hydrolase [Saprospiraceae bacterium]|nr:alpha/beta hydrolase [Saprospiraceae bacterium]
MSQAQKDILLFVHGMCHGAWCWQENFIPYFENKGYQCIAIDLPGHEVEGSDVSINHLSMKDYLKALSTLITSLERPPILIGHSMGGMVIQQYLKKGICKKVILMASVPPSGSLKASLRLLLSKPASIQYLLKGDLLQIARKYKGLMLGDRVDEAYSARFRDKLCAESMLAYFQLLFPIFNTKRIKRFPMLVIGGDNDQLLTIGEFKSTAKHYNADLEVIANGSHDLMLDPDYEISAAIIEQWIMKDD